MADTAAMPEAQGVTPMPVPGATIKKVDSQPSLASAGGSSGDSRADSPIESGIPSVDGDKRSFSSSPSTTQEEVDDAVSESETGAGAVPAVTEDVSEVKGDDAGEDETKAGLTEYEEETMDFTVTGVTLGDTRTAKDSKGEFTEYSMETVRSSPKGERRGVVWHRYSSFFDLFTILSAAGHSFVFPAKKWFGNRDPSFVAQRKAGLQAFVDSVLATPTACNTDAFRAFVLPGSRPDWPAQVGSINLEVHDCPHMSSVTEWWYYNAHVSTSSGREFSVFICFFRLQKHINEDTQKKIFGHALNWAITDVEGETYTHFCMLDKDAPEMVKKTVDSGVFRDANLKRSMMEVLEKGNVPLPDRLFNRNPKVALTTLDIDMEEGSVTKDSSGNYILRASLPSGKFAFTMTLSPRKPAIRHGLNGVVKGHNDDDMFYYFIPRCAATGTVTINGQTHQVSGEGWYDHEFGGHHEEGTAVNHDYGWNWASCQLGNGWDLTGAVLYDIRTEPHRLMETRCVLVGPSGERLQRSDMKLEPLNEWRSNRTFSAYPTHWRLTIESENIDLVLKASFDDQEFMTIISHPGFWEGRMEVAGTFRGARVTGKGFFERNGFTPLKTLMGFFGNVGKLVRKAVNETYPLEPTLEEATMLVATPETAHWMEGVPCDKLAEHLIKPFRVIADRGGKSWRSYAALACIDVVGGDSRNFLNWLAMPEFMHVGSLIVDDIQDKSETRRGGPCAHQMFGEAICINAGTAAYFQFQKIMGDSGLDDKTMVRIYDLYFQALRAGHAGQALDIAGLDYLMDDLVATGDAVTAESRILAIHRLKTAVPACVLAKMGALAGRATEEQVTAIGAYFEAVGVAFQIMDDVLNLRGLYTNAADRKANIVLKKIGEDIMAGKVTIPVVKAMAVLDLAERQALWDVVRSKPEDPEVVADTIQKLEDCGAIDACVTQATEIVEETWRILDGCTPDSFAKIMLRSFGWFVIERSK